MNDMPKKLLCWALALVLAFAPGCSVNVRFTYPLKPPIKVADKTPANVKIAVLPATDKRGSSNIAGFADLFLLPIVPWGWIEHERPEAARGFVSTNVSEFDANLIEDIPKAIAQHWREAGVARGVFFDYGLLADQADFTLHTTLNKTTYRGRITAYCISVFGVYLWFFGMPLGSFNVIVDIDLELRDQAQRVVWAGKIEGDHFMWTGLYFNAGADMDGLALTIQKQLDASAPEVIAALATRRVRRSAPGSAAKPKRKHYP